MRRLEGHVGDIQCLAFAPDGRTLTTGGDDGTVRLWDVATGEVRHRLPMGGMLGGLAISPDGYNLVAGTWEGHVVGWYLGREPSQWFSRDNQGRVSSVAFSADGQRLGWCSYRRVVVSTCGRWPDGTVRNPGFNQYSLRFAPDGMTFARAGGSAQVIVCDAATQKVLQRLKHGDKAGCWSVAFTPDGKTLVLGLESGLQVWDLAAAGLRHEARDHTDTLSAVALTGDATRLLTASYDGKVSVYEFSRAGDLGRRLETFDWKAGKLFDVGVTPDGTLAAVAGATGVVLWDLE